MYMNMPLELSEKGVKEYFESKLDNDDEEMTTEEIIEGLEICQANNVFEFKEQLLKQVKGHTTRQKQHPPPLLWSRNC